MGDVLEKELRCTTVSVWAHKAEQRVFSRVSTEKKALEIPSRLLTHNFLCSLAFSSLTTASLHLAQLALWRESCLNMIYCLFHHSLPWIFFSVFPNSWYWPILYRPLDLFIKWVKLECVTGPHTGISQWMWVDVCRIFKRFADLLKFQGHDLWAPKGASGKRSHVLLPPSVPNCHWPLLCSELKVHFSMYLLNQFSNIMRRNKADTQKKMTSFRGGTW